MTELDRTIKHSITLDTFMTDEKYWVTFKPLGAKRRKTLLGKLEKSGFGRDGYTYYLFKRLTPEGDIYINDKGRTEHFLVRESEVTSITPEEDKSVI